MLNNEVKIRCERLRGFLNRLLLFVY